MHGLDEYDSQARWYYPALMRTTTIDPLAEKYYHISPYAWCGNNPVRYVDPDGIFLETVWDVANLATGVKSFVDNVEQGNVGGSILDGIGIVVDAAVVIPIVPGGAGATIKALRTIDKVADAGKAVDKAVDVTKTVDNVEDVMKNRVKLRKDTKATIQSNASKTSNGQYIDPNTGKTIERGQEVYGHKTGQEWSKYKKEPENQGKTRKEVIEDQNNPNIYQIEDKKSNASHKYEHK